MGTRELHRVILRSIPEPVKTRQEGFSTGKYQTVDRGA